MLSLTLKAGVGGASTTERGELAVLPGGALLGEGGEGAEGRLRQDGVHVRPLEREHLHLARTAHEHRRGPSLTALRTLGRSLKNHDDGILPNVDAVLRRLLPLKKDVKMEKYFNGHGVCKLVKKEKIDSTLYAGKEVEAWLVKYTSDGTEEHLLLRPAGGAARKLRGPRRAHARHGVARGAEPGHAAGRHHRRARGDRSRGLGSVHCAARTAA